MKNKSTKSSKSTRNVAAASKTPRTSVDYTTRLNSSRGRFVGVMTINKKNIVSKYNGRVLSQSAQFVTVFDRNKNKAFKIAKNTIISLTGV